MFNYKSFKIIYTYENITKSTMSIIDPLLNPVFNLARQVPVLVPMRVFIPVGDDMMYTGFTGDVADGNSDPEDDNIDEPYISDDEDQIPDSEYARQVEADKNSADPDNDVEHLAANTEIIKANDKSSIKKVTFKNDQENDDQENNDHENDDNNNNNNNEDVHDNSCEHDAHYEENQQYRKLMEEEYKAKAQEKRQRSWKAGSVAPPIHGEEAVETAVDVLRALKLYHRITAPATNTDMFSSIEKFSRDTKDSLNSSYAAAGNQVEWKPEYLLKTDGQPSLKATSIIPVIQWILEHEPETWVVEQLVESGSMSQKLFSSNNENSGKSGEMHSIAENQDEEERDI